MLSSLPSQPARDHLLCLHHGRAAAVLVVDPADAAATIYRLEHLPGVGRRGGEGLLREHVLAGLNGQDHVLGVQGVGACHDHRVQVVPADQLGRAGRARHDELGHLVLQPGLVGVAHGRQLVWPVAGDEQISVVIAY